METTNSSSSKLYSICDEFIINKKCNEDIVVALAGNPNVGKSTVFNALTGLNQHTGNWSGKTVSNTYGYFKSKNNSYVIVDVPGTYSLNSHSSEEEIARNYLCFGKSDYTVILCDATCIEKNLNLAIQIMEMTPNVILCVNFLDEAKRKGINVNLKLLEDRLGVPVVGITARKRKNVNKIIDIIDDYPKRKKIFNVQYPQNIKSGIIIMRDLLRKITQNDGISFGMSKHICLGDKTFIRRFGEIYGVNLFENKEFYETLNIINICFNGRVGDITEIITNSIYLSVETVLEGVITYQNCEYTRLDRKLDRIFCGKFTAFPIMMILLAIIFWITLVGANYLSGLLSDLFLYIGNHLRVVLISINVNRTIISIICDGIWHVMSWVISVMLPPMAIFFPLFSLLEDSGYLPRVAFNLDKPFKKCSACGKQALTMCMGFGCNATGVMGTRIIDSDREKLLSILTNSFIPCNGRFPMLILIISIFFVGSSNSVLSAFVMLLIILLAILITFLTTKILSKTLLKGVPSSFALEMPPYRKPQFFKTLLHSAKDRVLFALGRAASVAAPAGLLIWIISNVHINGVSLLNCCADFLNPLGYIMGLDGIILMAFILGFPANEIVVPIAIMAYTSQNVIYSTNATVVESIMLSNGWGIKTAVCFVIFTLFHWPCSTTLLTIKKETKSFKWTILALLIPTLIGVILCILVNAAFTALAL